MHTYQTATIDTNRNWAVSSLVAFSSITFITSLGDAVMSYIAPNLVQGLIHNSLLMGIILSASSIVGLICDFTLSNLFRERSFYFYLLGSVAVAILFPLALLISPSLVSVILSMAIWGIYYELNGFSRSNYIHHSLPHDKHDYGWAFLNSFSSLAYLIAPTLVVFLSSEHFHLSLLTALCLQSVALTCTIIFRYVYRKQIHDPMSKNHETPRFLQGITRWQILNRRLWPILAFLFCLYLIDSTFWTVGALLVDKLTPTYPYASLLYVAYLLPTLLFGHFGVRLSRAIGKKRTAFLAGITGGLFFTATLFFTSFNWFMFLITLGSISLSISNPEIRGAIEDYCERLGIHSNSLVGLMSSTCSLAYIIGPITAGGIASIVGEQRTFGIMGSIIVGVSILCLIVVPRKIRLPQLELSRVVSE